MENVHGGISQGSVLGLVLFLNYINPTQDSKFANLHLFADDAKQSHKINDEINVKILQADLEKQENCP